MISTAVSSDLTDRTCKCSAATHFANKWQLPIKPRKLWQLINSRKILYTLNSNSRRNIHLILGHCMLFFIINLLKILKV